MAKPGRAVLPAEDMQAIARGEVLRHLRRDTRYQNITRQDLGRLWRTLVSRHPTAKACGLVMLDEIQHGPHEAWRWRGAPPEFQRDTAIVADFFGPDDPGVRAQQQEIADSGITACPELETYLHDLDAVVATTLRLTGREHASWWAMEAVHGDVAALDPGHWIRTSDPWLAPDPFSIRRRIDIVATAYDARITCVDGATGEPLWRAAITRDDWATLRSASERCLQDVESAATQHHQDARPRRNIPALVRMMNEDLPALIEWHFHNKAPNDPADRRRLRRVAREQLGVDPLPDQKKRAKPANFLASKRGKGRYGGNEA